MEKYKKIIVYQDELHDDFAENRHVELKTVDETFPFQKNGLVWRLTANLVYYWIAKPLVLFLTKLHMGLKIKNKKVLRKLRRQGYFLYGNHVTMLDPVIPALIAGRRKAYVIAGREAVSIPFLQRLVLLLGGLPVPSNMSGMKPFMAAIEHRLRQRACIAVYPEAHIWPYYTHIRPFPDTSFLYPARWNAPVVVMTTTFRRRSPLLFWSRRPGVTVTVSEPFYPDMSLPVKERRKQLRDRAYEEMKQVSESREQPEYYHYTPRRL